MQILDSLFKRRLIYLVLVIAFLYVSCSSVDGVVTKVRNRAADFIESEHDF